MSSYEDQIKQMYGANLTSQKEQLKSDYEAADQALTLQKEENQKITDSNLRQTRIDAQKSAVNNEEYYAASGLTSGAKAQARLAQDNQLLSNLTTIRTAQQEADAQIERQRATLAKEYESAITKAQADNDLALAKALYEQAQKEDAQLLAKQEAAAKLMAEGGDYSLLGQMYGLSNWQTALLGGSEATKTTVKALTANGVSEADRTGVMKTVRSMYTQMRASGATQAELDNYLVELRNAGILQKYEDAEIREDRNWSASASASTSDTGTTTTGEAAYTGPTFDKDSYLADTTEDLAVMLKDAEDWRNISQTYGGVHISRLPEDVKKRVTHYLEKYGSYDNLRKQMEGTYTGSNAIKYSINTAPVADPETYFLENATAIASKHHLATPTLTEKVVNFFNSTPSLAMALQQGLTKEEYRTMLTDRLFTLDLTEGEYSAILIASGLYT